MQPDDPDAARIWDMLTYAQEIMRSVAGVRFHDYMKK